MKIKCLSCGQLEELDEEDVKLVAHIVRKYNDNPKPEDYTDVLSIIKGNCSNGKKHKFIFDISFVTMVSAIIKEKNEAELNFSIRKDNLTQINRQLEDANEKVKELRLLIEELQQKRRIALADMEKTEIMIRNAMLRFEKLTGAKDIEIWPTNVINSSD